MPKIQLAHDADLRVPAVRAVSLEGDAAYSKVSCMGKDVRDALGFGAKKMDFTWRQVGLSAPSGFVVTLSNKTMDTRRTIIPPRTLVAGETYAAPPSQRARALLLAARALNAIGQSRVTLPLRVV